MLVPLRLCSSRKAPGNHPQKSPGNASFILHERGRRHHWEGAGSLSIKSFFHGQAYYDVGKGRYLVDDHSYLILNDAQPYTITIEAAKPVESLCLFFERGFVEEVHRTFTAHTCQLLDAPEPDSRGSLHFFERTYPHDDVLSPALLGLRNALARQHKDSLWLHEQMHGVAQRLLQVHGRVYEEVASLPAIRAATREELYRRLYRARDYIRASFDQPITLEDMARVACLSPNHFLRTFKQVFRQSPHQYLTAKRLEEAKRLLTQTERSVTDTCFAVGFESLGSFSSLFCRRIGLSPGSYRRQKR